MSMAAQPAHTEPASAAHGWQIGQAGMGGPPGGAGRRRGDRVGAAGSGRVVGPATLAVRRAVAQLPALAPAQRRAALAAVPPLRRGQGNRSPERGRGVDPSAPPGWDRVEDAADRGQWQPVRLPAAFRPCQWCGHRVRRPATVCGYCAAELRGERVDVAPVPTAAVRTGPVRDADRRSPPRQPPRALDVRPIGTWRRRAER